MAAVKETEKPFRVVTTDTKTFVAGFDDESAAKSSASDRNSAAEKMGIKTRYEAVAK